MRTDENEEPADEQPADEMHVDTAQELQNKRRKPRKGTRSCWQCKRRKVKCIFTSAADAVCISCTKRSLECVSQEFPDQTAPTGKSRLVGERFLRVEAMIAELAKQTGATPVSSKTQQSKPRKSQDSGIDKASQSISNTPTPISTVVTSDDLSSSPSATQELLIPGYFAYENNEPVVPLQAPHPPVIISTGPKSSDGCDRLEAISRALLALYPNEECLAILFKAGVMFMNLYLTNFKSYHEMESIFELPENEREDLAVFRTRHDYRSHPVVIAEQMLTLANVMQQADCRTLVELRKYCEDPHVIATRMVNAAISLVTSNDNMLATSEGLECLILESAYQAHSGNLRLAWLTRRRIVGLAQIIGIHRRPYRALTVKSLRANCVLDPRFIWYRVLWIERFLSLMLGLPAATYDSSMINNPAFSDDTLMGQLERRHCYVAGRILERNDRDPSADDFEFTQSIDMELQNAASAMPSKWWLTPDVASIKSVKEAFWEVLRLIGQAYHFYLLHQLHLPYMLLCSSTPHDPCQYDYSRNTCLSASRDILSRCLMIPAISNFPCCQIADLLAVMACLTLLLTHLSSKGNGSSTGMLAHQRLADRAMMEQVLENMEKSGPAGVPKPSSRGAKMLRQLLAIDDDSPGSSTRCIGKEDDEFSCRDGEPLRLFVPYFGMVIVSRNGEVTTEMLAPERAAQSPSQPQDKEQGNATGSADPSTGWQPGHQSKPQLMQPVLRTQLVDASHVRSRSTYGVDDSVPSEPQYPFPNAGADQWALQGVDFAFFDNLMRETAATAQDDGNAPWTLSTGI